MAARMIEKSNPEQFSIYRAVIVAPFGGLGPGFLVHHIVTVDDMTALRAVDRHAAGDSDGEARVFDVSKNDLALGWVKILIDVNRTRFRGGSKCQATLFGEQTFS